jgi:hypothetical protein
VRSMSTAAIGAPPRPGALPAWLIVLVTAFSAGVVAQGAYYPAGRGLLLGLVLVAAGLVPRPWPRPAPYLCALVAAGAALGGWAMLRAVFVEAYPVAIGYLATIAGVLAAALLAARADADHRLRLAGTLVTAGVVVAVTAWFGVAWRVARFAVPVEHRLWRGASVLTYPNAAAALLAVLALLALALFLANPRSWPMAGAVYLLLVGVGAALSRAGLLALLAGAIVLGLCCGVRRTVAGIAAPATGAAIAVGALVPSFPVDAPPHPWLALGGLLIGAVVALGGGRLPARWRYPALAVLCLTGAALLAARLDPATGAAVLTSRGNLDSWGRSGAARAAVELITRNPLVGTGAGQARFIWDAPGGNDAVALYAHNEYLQVLVDLGAIGLILLAALLAVGWLIVRRGGRHPDRSPLWAGAVAGLTALAVHSGFDFLWHMAVLPLLGGLLIGLASPATSEEPGNPLTEGSA